MNSLHPLSITTVRSEALTPKLSAEILYLCSSAYEEDFSPYLNLLKPAVHILGCLDGELVSHAAWVERELRTAGIGSMRTAYVEAVATSPNHQRKGYASALLAAIPELVTDFDIAALSPSESSYYQRLGWELWKGSLAYTQGSVIINTPDEEVMIYRLPRTPTNLDLQETLTADWRPGEVW